MVDLAIQQFHRQSHPGVLRSPRHTAQALGSIFNASLVIQARAIAAEDNQVANSPLLSQRKVCADLTFDTLVMLAPIQSLLDRAMTVNRNDLQAMIFNRLPVFLRNKFDAQQANLRRRAN